MTGIVCVTGGSGFIGSWLVRLLLDRGYTVHATVMRLGDEAETAHLRCLPGASDRLRLFQIDLLDPDSILAAIRGCTGVFHLASPCTVNRVQNPQRELLDPAVKGTLNVLRAAKETGVCRVVVTSSISAIIPSPGWPADRVKDESCWTDLDYCRQKELWYPASKTMAEKTAWEFAKENGLDVVVVNPGTVLGPIIPPTVNASMAMLVRLCEGLEEEYPDFYMGPVHVKDVALAHILAYENPAASGRHLCVESISHWSDFASKVEEFYPEFKLPRFPKDTQPGLLRAQNPAKKLIDLGMQFISMEDNSRIHLTRSRCDKYHRYVVLNTQDIYNALVGIYTPMLTSQWHRFKRYMEAYPPPAGITAYAYAARIYISGWLHDLYVSNREAVNKLSPLAYSQHFLHDETFCSYEYDEFLTSLNAAIRPTNIRGVPEDTLYIPVLNDRIDWNNHDFNYFGLNNYNFNYDCLLGLIGIMKDSKNWKIATLVTNTMGRPFWLYDWHSDNRCCIWFPTEGNYNMDDVSMAYIIGVACTPKLGPRDVDDWQTFPGGIIPQNLQPNTLERVIQRRFFGGYEVRTVEQRTVRIIITPPAQATKRARATRGQATTSTTALAIEPSSTVEVEQPEAEIREDHQFQITDWTYYHLGVINMDNHTRTGALRMLIFN